MLRLIVFILVMAAIAPLLTNLGRPFCGPNDFVFWRCGSFWWFLALCVVPLVDVALTLRRQIRSVFDTEKNS